MISATSNCSRLDAVKATANQLKLQAAQTPKAKDATSPTAKAVAAQLSALDDSVKAGDARKAELALAQARAALRQEDVARPEAAHSDSGGNFRSFLAYA
jgi:hypothetical protein